MKDRAARRFANALHSDPRSRDRRAFPVTGIVRGTSEHPSWGLSVDVEVVGVGVVECRPAYLGTRTADDGCRTVAEWPVGAEVLVIPASGSMNAALALQVAPSSKRQKPEKAPAAGVVQHEVGSHHDYRLASAPTATTYAVVAKPFLTDLNAFLDVLDGLAVVGTTIDVVGPYKISADTMAVINGLQSSMNSLAAAAAALRAQVQQSIATSAGQAPHCGSPLRVSTP